MTTKRAIQKTRREAVAKAPSAPAANEAAELVTLTPEQRAEAAGLLAWGNSLDAQNRELRAAAALHQQTCAAFWVRTRAALGVDPKRPGEYVAQIGAIQLGPAPEEKATEPPAPAKG
jgi:hypothetical protein